MKALYLSCHAILEYDELKLFEELGINYFSLGSYVFPTNPGDPIRPALTKNQPPEMYAHPLPHQSELTAEFVEQFDTIIVMHVPEWITDNWQVIKNKRVIWRTIGQSCPAVEKKLKKYRAQGLEVVRYSPREVNIEGNIGSDALIRFYKDDREFCNWNGAGNQVITFAQDMKHRGEHLNVTAFEKIVSGFNAKVYGVKNDDMGELNGGMLSYDAMKQKMRDARVFVYTGTQPASYTLTFIEAMMTGCPMVCLGSKHANSLQIAGDVYEIPDIIQNGVNGFVSDDIQELRQIIDQLTHDIPLAKQISINGRKSAIELFGKQFIKQQWSKFLCNT